MSEQIQDLVQAALDQNFNKANEVFNDMMTQKVTDALDQEKIAVANRIYNGIEPEEEVNLDDIMVDDPDLELDDDIDAEIDAAVDEFNSEDDEVEN